jgi:hypothetical protein
MTFGGPQQPKEFSVLSQVTNSFVSTQLQETKGSDMMFSQDVMGSSSGIGMKPAAPTLKKNTAAADSKKKWMRRI